jgi:hypothetical protein
MSGQLVLTGNGTDFQLDRDLIKSLKEETRPITVVTVAGQARTGKSFLCGLLAEHPSKKNTLFVVFLSLQSTVCFRDLAKLNLPMVVRF